MTRSLEARGARQLFQLALGTPRMLICKLAEDREQNYHEAFQNVLDSGTSEQTQCKP